MKVKDLFEHFNEYFDKIFYFDVSGNVEDVVTIVDGESVVSKAYDDFMMEYGGHTVIDWDYRYSGNGIDVQIEKDDDDEDLDEDYE